MMVFLTFVVIMIQPWKILKSAAELWLCGYRCFIL